jgi:uncharacterized peroxidase-related enzyme
MAVMPGGAQNVSMHIHRGAIMSLLTQHTLSTAPEASRAHVERALANNGFLPNLVAVLANSPAAIEAYYTVGALNGRTSLTLAERETVQITAAAVHGCGFCVAGHTAVVTKARLDADVVAALRALAPVPDIRLDAVARFTRAVIAQRGAVGADALRAFLDAGFTEAAALDVVLGVSLATLCNFANNLAGTSLNPELAAYAWTPAAA